MSLLKEYQLFLFDFDGLLVNTEELHFLAYKQMMENRGVLLTWSFERYCKSAHYSQEKFRRDLFEEFPALQKSEPSWDVLYKEKQEAMERLLEGGAIHLMPGVQKLLGDLKRENISHAVVTHSPDHIVNLIRKAIPLLNEIPHWITRHDYHLPKPNPECYKLAIERFSKPSDKVIGFEDTPRGLTALLGTRAKPVLVTEIHYPEIPEFLKRGVLHIRSLEEL